MIRDAMEWLKEDASRTIFGGQNSDVTNNDSRSMVNAFLGSKVTRVVVDPDHGNNVHHIGVEFSDLPKSTDWWLNLIVDVLTYYTEAEQDKTNANLIWFHNRLDEFGFARKAYKEE